MFGFLAHPSDTPPLYFLALPNCIKSGRMNKNSRRGRRVAVLSQFWRADRELLQHIYFLVTNVCQHLHNYFLVTNVSAAPAPLLPCHKCFSSICTITSLSQMCQRQHFYFLVTNVSAPAQLLPCPK